jgi:hypothetical protein
MFFFHFISVCLCPSLFGECERYSKAGFFAEIAAGESSFEQSRRGEGVAVNDDAVTCC